MRTTLFVAVVAFVLGGAASWAVVNRRSPREPARDFAADFTLTHHNPASKSPPPPVLRPYLVQVDGRRERVGPGPANPGPDDVWQLDFDRGRVSVWCVAARTE